MGIRQQLIANLLTIVCCILSAVASGCDSGLNRVVVAGKVTYRGEPVSRGSISFFPSTGTSGTSVIVAIADGKYKVDSLGGLPLGNYQVAILGTRRPAGSTAQTGADHPRSERPAPDSEVQYLPPKYNDKTELKATIDATQQPLALDFVLAE